MRIDGIFVTPQDNLVQTVYVDLLGDLLPRVTCLAKISKPQFDLRTADSVRLSRPSTFQKTGEALIKDDQEGRAHTSTSNCEIIESPKEAKALFDKRVRATNAGLRLCHTKLSAQSTVKEERTHTVMSEMTFGEDWLIYCTSLWPEPEKRDAWRDTFPNEYTSISKIYRPTQFAQALGMGVCEHIGATGKKASLKRSFHGFKTFEEHHPLQIVVHGPVLYVNNPYQYIQEARSIWAKICSMIFVKSRDYATQKEYRFAMLSIRPEVGEVFDLPISGMLKDCLLPVKSPLGMDDSPMMMERDEHESGEWHETCLGYTYRRRAIRKSRTGSWKDNEPGSSQAKDEIIEDTITSPKKIQELFLDEVKQPDIIMFERFGRQVRFFPQGLPRGRGNISTHRDTSGEFVGYR